MSVLDELFGDAGQQPQQQQLQQQAQHRPVQLQQSVVGLIETSGPSSTSLSSTYFQHPSNTNNSRSTTAGGYFSATLSAPQRSHAQTLSLLSTHYVPPLFPPPAVLWQWVQAGRFAEALTLLDGVGYMRRADAEAQQLLRTRNADDELEAAVLHRDRMRVFRAQALALHAGTTFSADFPNVSLQPFLSDAHCGRARAQVAGKLGQQFARAFQGCQSWTVVLEEERRQLRREVKYAAEAVEALVLTQAHSLPELVLLAAIVQMSRAGYFLCASLLPLNNNSGGGGTASVAEKKRPQEQQEQQQAQTSEARRSESATPAQPQHLFAADEESGGELGGGGDDTSRQSTSSCGGPQHRRQQSASLRNNENGDGDDNDDDDDSPVRPFVPSAVIASAAAALRRGGGGSGDGMVPDDRLSPTEQPASSPNAVAIKPRGGGGGGAATVLSSRTGATSASRVSDLENEIENALLAASHLIDRPSWRTIAALNRRRIIAHSEASAKNKRSGKAVKKRDGADAVQQQATTPPPPPRADPATGTISSTLIQEIAAAMQRCLRAINRFKAGGKIPDTGILASCSIMLAELLSALDLALPEALEGTGSNRTRAGVLLGSGGSTPNPSPSAGASPSPPLPRRFKCAICGAATTDAVRIRVPRFLDGDEHDSHGEQHQQHQLSPQGECSPPRRTESSSSGLELEGGFVLTLSKLVAAVEDGAAGDDAVAAAEDGDDDECETLLVDRDVWMLIRRHIIGAP